jgi:hypothetical protein
MTRSPRPQVAIILDTNALRGKHWLQDAVRQVVQEFRGDARVTVVIYIPEVVKREWLKNFVHVASETASRHNANTLKLRGMLGEEITAVEFDEVKLLETGERHLADLGVQTLPFNSGKFPVDNLLDRAVKNLPPFEADSDKGFKDAAIAHSVLDFARSRSDTEDIILITADQILNDYLNELLTEEDRVSIHSSVDAGSTELKLKLVELNKGLASEATPLFYQTDSKETLFYKEAISGKASGIYDQLFPDQEAARRHITGVASPEGMAPLGNPPQLPSEAIWVKGTRDITPTQTTFIKKEGNKLLWENLVIVYQRYELEDNSQGPSSEITGGPGHVVHALELKVVWSTTMSRGNPLTRPKFVSGPIFSNESAQFKSSTNFALGLSAIVSAVASIRTSISGLGTLSQPFEQLRKTLTVGSAFADSMNHIIGSNKRMAELVRSSLDPFNNVAQIASNNTKEAGAARVDQVVKNDSARPKEDP